jgi:flagellar hook-associated protein 1 FlgK
MTLDSALSIAGTGIAAVESQLAVISQNVANAQTTGYSTEVAQQEALAAGGLGFGVAILPTTRTLDRALQASVLQQNATVSGLKTTASALSAINGTQGTPGSSGDLPSLLGAVTDAFTTLADDPSNVTSQQAVVTAAQNLTGGINTVSQSYQTQRQDAQNAITSDVSTINSTLGTIGTLSSQIISLKAAGESTADLENQRDAAVASLSSVISVTTFEQSNGDLQVIAAGGISLPIHQTDPLSTSEATLGASATYPGAIPAITLGGADVTAGLAASGGSLGANLTLRDQTLPTYQAELDEFANQLSNRFAAQGLNLFTDGTGNLPSSSGPNTQSGYVGYAGDITVNPAVVSNPAAVRDGTTDITGSATGASAFTVNPSDGPASFSTLITRVLDYALGSDAQSGVAQPSVPTTGLGENGNLSAPYASQPDLTSLASALVAAQSADSSQATSASTTAAGVQTSMTAQLSSEDGVSVDQQLALMTQLQNAYGANAKVMAAVESMINTLLAAIVPIT